MPIVIIITIYHTGISDKQVLSTSEQLKRHFCPFLTCGEQSVETSFYEDSDIQISHSFRCRHCGSYSLQFILTIVALKASFRVNKKNPLVEAQTY